jgi:hypothetical protein
MHIARLARVLIVAAAVLSGSPWVLASVDLVAAVTHEPAFTEEAESLVAPTGERVSLHWTAVARGEASDLEMFLQRSADGGRSWSTERTCASRPDTKLGCGLLFELKPTDDGALWRAVVHNIAGVAASRWLSLARCDEHQCDDLAAPTVLRTATAGDRAATVSWLTPGEDGGSPVAGYLVTPYVGYAPQPSILFRSTATTQVVTGLVNGREYRFRVQAVTDRGTSAHSTASNPVTPSAAAVGA